MDDLAFNYNDYNVKCKNKYESQQIQKKFKNKHHYRYNDIDKRHYIKTNRIKHKKASKIIDFKLKMKSHKKQGNVSMKGHYKISVDICLIQNKSKDNIFKLDHSKYRIIPCVFKDAVIKVYDKYSKLFYLAYSFTPSRRFYIENSNDILYLVRNDVYIPLLFDEYNVMKYKLTESIFNDNKLININEPLFKIAQQCLDERNSTDYIDCNWNISKVTYIENRMYITVTTTVSIENESDTNAFIKSRPFSRKMMNSMNVFNPNNIEKLKCELSTKDGENIYLNIPLILDRNIVSTKTFLIAHFDKLRNILIPQQSEKKETKKYWFCHSCFMMNECNDNYECIKCNTIACYDIKWYYDRYDCNDIDVALTQSEDKAVNYVNKYSKKASSSSKQSLLKKIKKSHTKDAQEICNKLLKFMAEKVPLIIHLKTKEIIPKLLADTHYKNLFEVGSGGGCTNQDTRSKHENEMFPNIYNKMAKAKEKPKYGCLNIGLQPNGCRLATSYGASYFTLKNETVRWRVSYTNEDSFCAKGTLGTLNNCQHLLNSLCDYELNELIETAVNGKLGGYKQTKYREIQIHGPILLNRDIQSLHIPKKEEYNSHIYQQFAYKNSCKLIWF